MRGIISALLAFLFIPIQFIQHPDVDHWLRKVTATGTEGGWLWSWAWGGDSTVSIVDRSPPVTFISRPASFGPSLENPIMGYVIPMSSFTTTCKNSSFGYDIYDTSPENIACGTLCVDGRRTPEQSESWIALIQRGNCSFIHKVREAQRFGAKAVVMGGSKPEKEGISDSLISMYGAGDTSDVKIPSTFIRHSDYEQLWNFIESSNTTTSGIQTVSLQISADLSSWEWYSPILTFIILLLLPSSITLVTLVIHRFRLAQAARRDRAPVNVVNNLPWHVWSTKGLEKFGDDHNQDAVNSNIDLEQGNPVEEPSTSSGGPIDHPWFKDQTECAICLAEFENGDRVRVLPCKHIFHMDEVDVWLLQSKKLCPVCKSDVTKPRSTRNSHPNTVVNPSPNSGAVATERTPLLRPPEH